MSYHAAFFCDCCGRHRLTAPFGDEDWWRNGKRGPCSHCGADAGYSHFAVAKPARVGRWPWQRGWLDRDGQRVDVTARQLEKRPVSSSQTERETG